MSRSARHLACSLLTAAAATTWSIAAACPSDAPGLAQHQVQPAAVVETAALAATHRMTDSETAAVASPSSPIPAYAAQALGVIRRTGEAPPGFRGGTPFHNNEHLLPPRTSAGASVRYREWDVHPWVRGRNRGAERLVTGSDGSAYYTADHYQSFVRVLP